MIKIKYNNAEYEADEECIYWVGNDCFIPLTDGTELKLKNCYMQSLKYENLDYSNEESITLVGSNRLYLQKGE